MAPRKSGLGQVASTRHAFAGRRVFICGAAYASSNAFAFLNKPWFGKRCAGLCRCSCCVRERSQEECTAWRLQKQRIVKGGSTLIRWLFVIDIMLFGFYVITPRIPFNWNAHLARQVALQRSRAQRYSGEVFEHQEYSEVVEVEEYDDAYDDPYQSRYRGADVDQGGSGYLDAADSAKTRSPYKLGADKLMDSMRRIISSHKTQQGGLPANSDSLFKRCMEGVDLMIKDHIRYDWDEKKLDGCTYNVPKTPLTLSDRFFKSGRRRTMPEFFDYIKRYASSAIKANRIFEAVFDEPPKARVQACFNLMEDHYIRNTTKTARHALKKAIRRPHDILSKVSWLLRWALRDRVPRWLSRRNRQGFQRTKAAVEATDLSRADAAAGDAASLEAERFNESIAAAVRRHLQVVDAEFMNSMRHRDVPLMSLFTADTQYVKKRKAVVVSPGLVSVIMNVTHSTDPIATVLIGAPIMRAMVPRRQGAYKWRWANQNNLNRAVKCVERKMASSKAIAERVQTESAVLEPLFDAYRRSLADEMGLGTRLTKQYSNNELFYVLWAHGHCDDPLADVVVNGVANNSAHFAKTFGCSRGDRLWSEDKCRFWT
ncbi:hypothetical protein HPB50_005650 [Hyalomma asiaticum]|uniref:Uncharacterized protein n=1 Tax=Hyalomma asiaticum TaxID=266040 RepID=A0ACB7RMS7_HYAAI|nr:hypothetical protein HPB50_005650 [Hyalomma asiaticum]